MYTTGAATFATSMPQLVSYAPPVQTIVQHSAQIVIKEKRQVPMMVIMKPAEDEASLESASTAAPSSGHASPGEPQASAYWSQLPRDPAKVMGSNIGKKSLKFLCVGDSNTYGWGEGETRGTKSSYTYFLNSELNDPKIEITKAGFPGFTSGMIHKGGSVRNSTCEVTCEGIQNLLTTYGRYHLTYIMVCTNNMWPQHGDFDVGAALADVMAMHEVCHNQGCYTVNIAPPSACNAVQQQRDDLAKQMKSLLSSLPMVLDCVDSEEILPRSQSNFWQEDYTHISNNGAHQLGKTLAERIAPLISDLRNYA